MDAADQTRRPRVLVTGIALATGLGADWQTTWQSLIRGGIAVRRLDDHSLSARLDQEVFHGCPIPGVPRGRFGPRIELLDRLAEQALADSGPAARVNPERAGVVVGLSKGWVEGLSSPPGSSPADWLGSWPDAGARRIAAHLGWRGPSLGPVAACATGVVAALQAVDLIRRGLCDLVIAGAADASLHPLILGAFSRMKVLARVDESAPEQAIRPCDRGRTGFLPGEGGALLVLEPAERVFEEGRTAYAELAGGMIGADAYHITNLSPDPSHLAHVIRLALLDAGVSPSQIDHVNLHGTATRTNDPLECQALRAALGPVVDGLSCSANKAQIGHLLGAAGAAELALTCLAVKHGFVPPTMNLTDPDPQCDLDATPRVGKPRNIRSALKLSLGFGGHLAAAVVQRVES